MIWTLCSLVISFSVQAQTEIMGTIRGKDTPIAYANIVAKDTAQTTLYQFAISDQNGAFTLVFKAIPELPFIIEISSIGYTSKTIVVRDFKEKQQKTISVLLEENIVGLEEIVIKGKQTPITVQEDTATYRIDAFTNGEEVVLEDILKKLPGIEVEKNGKVKYKGVPISKLLLDGDDLFDLNYTIGTKNIRADKIEAIQGIDHYLENSVLKGIESSDDVVLNIKLKKGKTSISGQSYIGIGTSSRMDVGATVLGINERFKGFALAKYNNTGFNYSPIDLHSGTAIATSPENKPLIASPLIPILLNRTEIGQERVNFNQQKYGGLHWMIKRKTNTIKINADLIQDEIKNENRLFTLYQSPADTFRVTQNERKKLQPQIINLEINWQYLPNQQTRLKIQALHQHKQSSIWNVVENNGAPLDFSQTESAYLSKFKTEFTRRLNKTSAIRINAIAAKSQDHPNLLIQDQNKDVSDKQVEQWAKHSKETVELTASFIHKLNKANWKTTLLYRYQSIGLQSQNNSTLQNTNNHFQLYNSIPQLSSFYKWKKNKWSVTPGITAFYLNQNLDGQQNQTQQSLQNFLVNPSLSLLYKISKTVSILTTYSFQDSPVTADNLYEGFIVNSYRTARNNIANLSPLQEHKAMLHFQIYDLFNLFNLNCNVTYNKNLNAYAGDNLVTTRFSTYTNYRSQNRNDIYFFNFKISKYLHFLRGTVILNNNHGRYNYENKVNDGTIRKNKQWSNYSRIEWRSGFKSWFNFSNFFHYQFNQFNSSESNNSIKRMYNTLELHFSPIKNMNLKVSQSIFSPNRTLNNNFTTFYDLSIVQKFPKTNTEIALEAKNMSDNTAYTTFQNSDFSYGQNQILVQPFYFLIKFGFRF